MTSSAPPSICDLADKVLAQCNRQLFPLWQICRDRDLGWSQPSLPLRTPSSTKGHVLCGRVIRRGRGGVRRPRDLSSVGRAGCGHRICSAELQVSDTLGHGRVHPRRTPPIWELSPRVMTPAGQWTATILGGEPAADTGSGERCPADLSPRSRYRCQRWRRTGPARKSGAVVLASVVGLRWVTGIETAPAAGWSAGMGRCGVPVARSYSARRAGSRSWA